MTTPTIAEAQGVQLDPSPALELMEHALGKNGYRNHYATNPDDVDAKTWDSLVELKLAVRGRSIPGGLVYYHVSAPGMAFMRALYPRRYKL